MKMEPVKMMNTILIGMDDLHRKLQPIVPTTSFTTISQIHN